MAPTLQFTLENKDGTQINPAKIDTKYKVLYFYPRDNTPGCTIEAKEYTDLEKEFKKNNTTVIGISGGSNKTKTSFCEKHSLTITLLTDSDCKVAKTFNAYGEKSFMGKAFQGIKRNTYLFKENTLIKTWENVKAKGHAQDVLNTIKENEK